MSSRLRFASSLVCIGMSSVVQAAIKLPALFGNGMVLQRDLPATVWGSAEPGEKVTVEVAKQMQRAVADKAGTWRVTFQPLSPGEPLKIAIRASSGSLITLENVLVGDVWLCSGQSNMEFRVGRSATSRQAIENANIPSIRIFKVATAKADTPQTDCKGSWETSSPRSIPDFSAVAFFFGRKLNEELKVPIGLIQSTRGGTRIESWTSRRAMEAQPDLKFVLDRERRMYAAAPADQRKFDAAMQQWDLDAKTAEQRKENPPTRPTPDLSIQEYNYPARLYNGMIAPLTQFPIRGVIWYQGEANVGQPDEYRTLLPTMIQDWRSAWANSNLPFGFVQLPPYGKIQSDPNETAARAELREAQLLTLEQTHDTGMAVTMDVGDIESNHPIRKQEVGERLARWALAKVYRRNDVIASGPVLKSAKVEGNAIRLSFDPVTGPLRPADSAELRGFTVAGDDRKFAFATAQIDGNDLLISAPSVAKPVAVRYGWAFNPICNLVNDQGLPASPFRTDDWQLEKSRK